MPLFLLILAASLVLNFTTISSDGTPVLGERDGAPQVKATVIFVPGTGAFDRDGKFGRSGTDRDFIFKDLGARLNTRGIATVRYDLRGVTYGASGEAALDRVLLARRTTTTMRDDLGAVYKWTRDQSAGKPTCVIFIAHSEGMEHLARLAKSGAPAPLLVVGIGGAMESPAAVVRWQMSGRDSDSLQRMDRNNDGRVTNEEVNANWMNTPSAVFRTVGPFLSPAGVWTADDLHTLEVNQAAVYDAQKAIALAHSDDEPYPNVARAFTSYQWWKSWFLDEESAASRLSTWPATKFILHYGEKDSQTSAGRQVVAAKVGFPRGGFTFRVHPGLGHTLGSDVLFGPMSETVADEIADEIKQEVTAAGKRCR